MIYNYVFWIQVVSLIYVGISVPLYVFVIVALLWHRKKESYLKNSFFVLWIHLGICDISHGSLFWFSGKFPLMGLFPSFYLNAGGKLAGFLMYLVFTTHYGQVFGIGLLSINRLTALLYPTKSEPFWLKKRTIPLCIVAIWAVALVMSVPVAVMETNWVQKTNNSKVSFHFLSVELATQYFFVVGILLALATSAIVGVYIIMFYKVKKMSVQQRQSLKTQTKLAMCAFFVAAFLALLAVCFCLFSFYTDHIAWGDNAIFFLVSCDLNTFCNVHLLICTSKVVRKRAVVLAKRVFCCKKEVEQEQGPTPGARRNHRFTPRSKVVQIGRSEGYGATGCSMAPGGNKAVVGVAIATSQM